MRGVGGGIPRVQPLELVKGVETKAAGSGRNVGGIDGKKKKCNRWRQILSSFIPPRHVLLCTSHFPFLLS